MITTRKPPPLKAAMAYRRQLVEHGAVMQNITNWVAHYLYGTDPAKLAAMSKQAIQHSPPGHR